MNVVDHQLEIVAVDVVVQAAGDGVNAVVTLLPRVYVLPAHRQLKFLRDKEVTSRDIVPACCEVRHAWHTIDGAAIDVLLKILTDQIKWTQLKPRIQAPGRPLVRCRQRKGRERTIVVDEKV